VIAYPTEAVYGLGCDPLNPHAVMRLLQLKRRPAGQGLILIAADFHQLQPFVLQPSEERMRELMEGWPGPFTWLLPAAPDTPWWLTGYHDTLAVRVTAHPVAAALCRSCTSALVSTSANISGRPPPRSALALRRALSPSEADYILQAPCSGLSRPTPIRDARTGDIVRV
jgi:L-threonylcarbamoyladenylate synthase